MGILEAPSASHGAKPPSSIGDPISSFPPAMFSVPPPSTPSLSPPMSSVQVPMTSAAETPAVSSSQAAGKAARQEQLIRKLSEMLPGADDDTIKRCINELRARHGKLSGMLVGNIIFIYLGALYRVRAYNGACIYGKRPYTAYSWKFGPFLACI